MSHWRQAAELGCKYALNFRSILWLIVNVTPKNAGFMNINHKGLRRGVGIQSLIGAFSACVFAGICSKHPSIFDYLIVALTGGFVAFIGVIIGAMAFESADK